MSPISSDLVDLDNAELRIAEFMLSQSGFVGSYVRGEYFQSHLQSLLGATFLSAPRQIKDGFLAAAGALASIKSPSLKSTEASMNFQRGASAMNVFRQTQPFSSQDMTIALGLALALVSFSHFAVGRKAHPICRHVLQQLKNFDGGSFVDQFLESDPNITCILFLDYFDCLLHRERPVLRYPVELTPAIDRYYGVCSSLLPTLYDLCEVGYNSKHGLISQTAITQELQRIILAAKAWTPRFSLGMTDKKFDIPLQQLLSQARALQLATILLAYRYYPATNAFDSEVAQLSNQIRAEIRELRMMTGTGPIYIDFPYLVAMLEVTDPEEQARALSELNSYSNHVAPMACQTTHEFLLYYWEAKKANPSISWLTLVDLGL